MKTYRNLISLLSLTVLFPAAVFAGTLADTPLSLKGGVPPNVMFAVSVEFPTANTAAYQGQTDYSSGVEYLGYFDPDKCYDYDSGNGWFAPTGMTATHECVPNWSGNFLNWATMTGIDEFRFAMTGGNRSTDTATNTVLERSFQSGQGGTGNFPDKTWTEYKTTPWPGGTPLTLQNQGKGIQMTVTPNGTDTANCTGPSVSGSFSCGAIALASDGTNGSCSSYSGSGTAGSPYKCTSFGAFSGVTATSVTPAISSTGTTAAVTTTANCTSPALAGAVFSCNLALTNGSTGTCSTAWTGTGATSGTAYTCGTFGTFSGGETFNSSGGNIVSSFATTAPGTTVVSPAVTCTVTSGVGTSCTWSGHTASCAQATYVGTGGSSGAAKYCPSLAFAGSEVYISAVKGTPVKTGGVWYMTNYTISYQIPVSTTKYYVSAYPGNDTVGYYYYSTYNVAFGTAQTFNVRVKVCDNSIGLESNCKQIGTSYKPTGSVQDNGDKMKFGVTSYFQANDVDNAVLRSKAKYVAPTKYSSSGGTIANALTEWNAADGTLIKKPDATDAATATSFIGSVADTGVINYINKFGSTSHTYKTYDTMGKLYYETLKYLRGKTPTTDFYNGAKTSNSDGFPVITTWDDPVQYTCQKNYIIAMGDTHTWCDKRLPGGTHSTGNNGVCNAYTDGNGNAHVEDKLALSGDAGVDVTTSTNAVGTLEGLANLATSYTGAGSSAGFDMAGLAYWAASQDFRPDLVGAQHVQTYVIDVQENKDCGYQSQYWLAAKYGKPDSYDSVGTWLTTGNPAMSTTILPASNCSSRAPAGYVAGGGSVSWPKNLLRAGDPLSMIASVKAAIADIAAQIGDEAALSQSSGSLDTGTGAYIYRALYNSGGWQGDVQALTIATSGAIGSTPAWKASAMLPAAASRNIFTFNDGRTAAGASETTTNSRKGVAFTAASIGNLSTGQQALLNTNELGATDGNGDDRINWLRGDQSKEAYLPDTTTPNASGNGWRARASTSLLGDVINSNPVFVGAPSSQPGAGYATFYAANKNRTPMIYVGGNDGMVHGYDASFTVGTDGMPVVTSNSGKEKFAYVPSSVYNNLNKLMGSNYSHKYFVDGSPVVGDACFGNTAGSVCSAAASWKTMLVGGLNAGGQGIYALDVTDPTMFGTSKVMWEFTDKDDADLGYTFSKPIIVKLNNQKWAVIFGNGYNNPASDGSASTTGRAYLYILYVDGPGAGNPWVLNTDYFKIELKSPTESGTPLVIPNGLASVAGVDKDRNGTVDIVYAGDRDGNLWKVDLTSTTASSWKAAFGSVSAPQPLFTAVTSIGALKQQITTGVEVARHPRGGFLVMFGTGAWVDATDNVGPFTAKSDSFYGIWDKDDGSTRVTSRTTQLQEEKIILNVDKNGNSCSVGTAGCFGIMSNCQPNYTSASVTATATDLCPNSGSISPQLGYFFDLPGSGERTRSSAPILKGGVVTFTTLTPATDPCAGNTLGYEYSLNFLSGGAPLKPAYLISGTTTALITVTIGTTVYQLPAAAVVTAGGATDNAINFNITKETAASYDSTAVPTAVAGMPLSMPGAPCIGKTDCPTDTFIPGWGFLLNNQGPTAPSRYYYLSCSPNALGSGPPTCTPKPNQGKYGKLGWKQINR